MPTRLIHELAEHPEWIHRHTIEAYDGMIPAGLIEEGSPFELLDGQIVLKIRAAIGEPPMTVGTWHSTVTTRLADLNIAFKPQGCHIRVQLPLVLPPHDKPESDGLIVRGTDADYTSRHPTADDVLCIMEVSDASLQRDRGSKLELYASRNLSPYFIFNLARRIVEVRTGPIAEEGRYAHTVAVDLDGTLQFPTLTGKPVLILVRQLLG